MATIQKQALEIKTPDKGLFMTFTEATSATFKRGELVTLSSGKVAALSGTDPSAGTILGVAMADASGTVDTECVIFVPEPECVFVANLGGTSVTAVTDIGTLYGLVEASDLVHVDKTETSATKTKVVGLDKRDTVGDTNGRVEFKFLAAALQLTGAVS